MTQSFLLCYACERERTGGGKERGSCRRKGRGLDKKKDRTGGGKGEDWIRRSGEWGGIEEEREEIGGWKREERERVLCVAQKDNLKLCKYTQLAQDKQLSKQCSLITLH